MKKITFFFLLIINAGKLFSQVNLPTGSATFSLPMFNWQDDKSRLNSVVGLNYNSGSGLKVAEVASVAGQGWSLLAGGSITRMQVGEPDDQKSYLSSSPEQVEDLNKYPAGYLYNTKSAADGCPVSLAKYPIFGDKNHLYKQHNKVMADRELDYFSFQFNGRSGLFVLNKNTNEGVCLGDSKIKISFEHTNSMTYMGLGIRTTISRFTITDENGLIYRFGKYEGSNPAQLTYELTKVLKTGFCDRNQKELQTQPKFEDGGIYHETSIDRITVNPYVINGWFLYEIEDGLITQPRKITFSYTSVPRDIYAFSGEEISYYDGDKQYVVISHKFSKSKTPEITSVTYPDGHTVTFNYGAVRFDLSGSQALASVDIKYNGRFLSKYVLNTSYFILNRYGTPVSEYQKAVSRLCLMSVKKYGVDLKGDEAPYLFDYHMGSNAPYDYVPPPFYHVKDTWGYYNGDNSRDVYGASANIILTKTVNDLSFDQLRGLCFLRAVNGNLVFNPDNVKEGYSKNGLLRQVIYPTGGTLTYEYAQNKGLLNAQNMNVGGVHVASTSTTDGGYSNNCSTPIITKYDYVLSKNGPSSMWGLEMPQNSVSTQSHYEGEHKYWYYKFPFGSCSYRYQYPGILSREDKISLTGFQRFMEAISPVLDIVNIITTVMDVVNVCLGSTGWLAWVAVIVDIIGGLLTVVLTCFTSSEKNFTTKVYYNVDLNSMNPLPTQFKRVEIIPSTGDIGRTVQVFTSKDEYDIWEQTNPIFSRKQRYAHWAYGLPRFTTVYDKNDKKIKETENIYDYCGS